MFGHTGNGQAASGNRGTIFRDSCYVLHRFFTDVSNLDVDFKLVLEPQRFVKLERSRDTWKANCGTRWGNAEPCCTPERVLRLLHVAIKVGEVDDAGGVGLVEVDSPCESVLARWHERIVVA